jgi:transcription elongation factor GreA
MSAVTNQAELITREGFERLTAALEHLKTGRRQEVADALREARADGGDLGENPAVAEALDAAATLERRIEELTAVLAACQIAEPPEPGVVGVGQHMVLRLSPDAAPTTYQLVGALETDPGAGRISTDSPVGRAVMGRQAGDRVKVEAPGGDRTIQIVDVAWHEDRAQPDVAG